MKIRNFDIQDMELDGVTGDVQNGIEFDNGWIMCDCHWQDCCENVYAAWNHLKDEVGVNYDFDEKSFRIEVVEGQGFRFGDGNIMLFVPCYNEQNGYYNSNLEIKVFRKRQNGSYVKLRRFDTYVDTIDDIY